eukprot:1051470-Prymnesium_polylepis.1
MHPVHAPHAPAAVPIHEQLPRLWEAPREHRLGHDAPVRLARALQRVQLAERERHDLKGAREGGGRAPCGRAQHAAEEARGWCVIEQDERLLGRRARARAARQRVLLAAIRADDDDGTLR